MLDALLFFAVFLVAAYVAFYFVQKLPDDPPLRVAGIVVLVIFFLYEFFEKVVPRFERLI